MSTENPPDGWTVTAGAWGTSIDREEPADLVPNTGLYSVKFSTTAQGSMVTDKKDIETDRPYRVDWVVRASRADSGDNWQTNLLEYGVTGTLLTTNTLHLDGVISPINTWNKYTYHIVISDSSARQMAIQVKKANSQAINMWLDRVSVQRVGYSFAARRDASAQTFNDGAYTALTFDVQEYDYGNAFVHTTGIFTCKEAGLYQFNAAAAMGGVDDTERASLGLHVNGTLVHRGANCIATTANQQVHVSLSTVRELAVGDTVDVRILHNSGANDSQVLDVGYNWFNGTQLPPFGSG